MAILAIISTAFENSVAECFHFQRLASVEDAGTSMCRGNANRSAFPNRPGPHGIRADPAAKQLPFYCVSS